MDILLEHPAVQAALAPLLAALLAAALLSRTRFAWLALIAGYAAMLWMTTGISFTPLSASRKVMLLVLLAPLAGIALDLVGTRADFAGSRSGLAGTRADLVGQPMRAWVLVLAIAAGAATVWVFANVLAQKEGIELAMMAAGPAVFVAALVALVLRLRGDGVAAGAAGVGMGLAAGVGALLSASSGYFMAGVSFAAGAGALLLLQVTTGRARAPGFTGALVLGLGVALFGSASAVIAQMPWYALVLLLGVPALVSLPLGVRLPMLARAALLTAMSVAAGAVVVGAAWVATRGGGA